MNVGGDRTGTCGGGPGGGSCATGSIVGMLVVARGGLAVVVAPPGIATGLSC